MKRVNAFLAIIIASLAALIIITAIGFSIFTTNQNPYNWMSQMFGGNSPTTGGMGGMMGQTGQTTGSTNPLVSYFGVIFAVLIAITIVGIVGLSYYVVYPQMRMGTLQSKVAYQNLSEQTSSATSPYESVSKTLTAEERRIIEVLNNHNGKYLQKYIRNETGSSRLKTHRIIARLADRGIVTLEKTGNTNQVFLADWLQNPKTK
jgi:uncharacterized membrane protein